jgi:hypothetical protein
MDQRINSPAAFAAHMTSSDHSSREALPYVIELWSTPERNDVELVLARALSLELARSIFKAATTEYPERRLTLRKDRDILADSQG